MLYSCKKDYGYFLDNKFEFLDSEGEWFYDPGEEKLFLYAKKQDELPGNIEAVVTGNGIGIKEGVNNVVIKDICIEKFDNACVFAYENSAQIEISNCNLKHAGVYGIHIEPGTQEYIVANNTITDIRGRGISTLELSNSVIENNTLKKIGLYPLYGFNGVNNAVGIAVLRNEITYLISQKTFDYIQSLDIDESVKKKLGSMLELPYTSLRYFKMALVEKLGEGEKSVLIDKIVEQVKREIALENNQSTKNIIRYNVIDSTGYIGLRMDGTYSIAENNVVKNTILHMNDGGAIYCWAQHDDYTHHNIIRGNIVINAVGSPEATPNNRIFGIGIYVDNRSHDMLIENNTVSGAKAGILLNDETYKSTITGNTTYDNLYGIMFSEYFRPGTLKDNKVNNNIFFCKQRHQRCVFNESRIRESFAPAGYDSNFYGSPYYTYFLLELTFKDGVRRYQEYTLESWQEQKGHDLNSRFLAPEDPEDRGNESFLIYNDTREEKVFDIERDWDCLDIYGKVLPGKIALRPYESRVIVLE